MKTIFKAILFTVAAFALSVSCTEEIKKTITETDPYINLSRLSYTFNSEDDRAVDVIVATNLEWTLENENDWINVRNSNDTVFVSVAKNESVDSRSGKLIFHTDEMDAEFIVEQLPHYELPNARMYKFPLNAKGALSPSGKYAAYIYWELNLITNVYTYYGKKINLETEEVTDFEVEQYNDYGQYYTLVNAISDDGRTMILGDDLNTTYDVYYDGEKVNMNIPSEYKVPMYAAVSADGSVIVGTVMKTVGYGFVPVRWTNGELEVLESPKYSCTGELLTNGVIVRGCSRDGSIIYGSDWDTQGVIYWKNDRMFYPGLDYAEGSEINRAYMYAAYFAMSPNGKYIACNYGPFYCDPGTQVNKATLISTETGDLETLDPGYDVTGMTANDNGVVFGGTPAMGTSESLVFDFESGNASAISGWMKENYDINLKDTQIITYVTDNDKSNVFYGYEFKVSAVGTLCPPFVLVVNK